MQLLSFAAESMRAAELPCCHTQCLGEQVRSGELRLFCLLPVMSTNTYCYFISHFKLNVVKRSFLCLQDFEEEERGENSAFFGDQQAKLKVLGSGQEH